jgi:hypothetical protein
MTVAWLADSTGKLFLAQRLLRALRAAGAALHGTDTVRAADAGWGLGDAALIARALADLSAQLPAVIATVKTAVDHAGTPVEVEGYLEALGSAEQLVAHTHRMAHDLDPHYGPHGRHPHHRR